jgi:orotate phosphoribosyltransferase
MVFSSSDRARLAALLQRHSVKQGDFVLASGQRSSFYLNVKATSLLGEGAELIGRGLWQLAREADSTATAFGGLTLGADPLLTAIAIAGHHDRVETAAIIVRKDAKAHGTMQYLEMPAGLEPGQRVVAVDDVITTAGSTITAIERLRAEGFEVKDAVCVVDRRAGGRERLAAIGVELHALYGLDEFVSLP